MSAIETFLTKLRTNSKAVTFQEVIALIDTEYEFTPAAFKNGDTYNESGQNSGSCKLFSFAKLNELSEQETLNCFGDYYRIDVVQHPDKEDHQNIRNFIKYGWNGIQFSTQALQPK